MHKIDISSATALFRVAKLTNCLLFEFCMIGSLRSEDIALSNRALCIYNFESILIINNYLFVLINVTESNICSYQSIVDVNIFEYTFSIV